MDGFSLWLITAIFFSWLTTKPAPLPPSPLKESAILLPEPDGKPSGIVIKTGAQELAVTEPFHGVELTGGKIVNKTITAEEIQQLYPDVMQALPDKPRSFTFQFEENGTKLKDDSMVMIGEVQKEIARRTAPEITVIGHTDRAGSDEANLRLSLDRAAAVRDILVSGGVPTEIIQIIGRGELEPAVITEDGVVEPRNRRVEITVR